MQAGETLTTVEKARGRWKTILPRFGIDTRYLNRKNGPCPLCGGRDRWRFLDYDGSGKWVCNQCGLGNGFDLLERKCNLDFRSACEEIDRMFPGHKLPPRDEMANPDRAELIRRCKATWDAAQPISPNSKVECYLVARGINLPSWPRSLRERGAIMFAKIISPKDEAISLHCTNVETRERKFMRGSVPSGSAVRLFKPTHQLGIAEGIETALSAHVLFGVPVWSVLHKDGIEKFRPPDGVTEIIIFADNDANGVGQVAAARARDRLTETVSVTVKMPEQVGTDWNDVLREGKK